ncbi:hypothetical protein [Parahaliea maris]|nr:hypothetical protein [Parahaliea maris]
MTQHILEQDTREDVQIMRRLAIVIGSFMLATAALATTITLIAG